MPVSCESDTVAPRHFPCSLSLSESPRLLSLGEGSNNMRQSWVDSPNRLTSDTIVSEIPDTKILGSIFSRLPISSPFAGLTMKYER
jgi:hypothetical protein